MEELLYKTLVEGKQEMGILILLLWLLPNIAYVVDFITGVMAAKATKERIYTGGYRKTFKKASTYWSMQLMAVLFDIIGSFYSGYTLPCMSMAMTLSILTVEGLSVRENLVKMKANNALVALGLTEKAITAILSTKNKEDAIKALVTAINEHEHKEEEL